MISGLLTVGNGQPRKVLVNQSFKKPGYLYAAIAYTEQELLNRRHGCFNLYHKFVFVRRSKIKFEGDDYGKAKTVFKNIYGALAQRKSLGENETA